MPGDKTRLPVEQSRT